MAFQFNIHTCDIVSAWSKSNVFNRSWTAKQNLYRIVSSSSVLSRILLLLFCISASGGRITIYTFYTIKLTWYDINLIRCSTKCALWMKNGKESFQNSQRFYVRIWPSKNLCDNRCCYIGQMGFLLLIDQKAHDYLSFHAKVRIRYCSSICVRVLASGVWAWFGIAFFHSFFSFFFFRRKFIVFFSCECDKIETREQSKRANYKKKFGIDGVFFFFGCCCSKRIRECFVHKLSA